MSVGVGGADVGQKLAVLGGHHAGPLGVGGAGGQAGCSVHAAGFAVELVGELVEHDVAAVVRLLGAALHIRPGQHHGPAGSGGVQAVPTLAGHGGDALVHHAPGAGGADEPGERGWVEQHGGAAGEVVGVAMQQQQAGLGGDQHTHLVGDGQAVAALEAFLGQEDGDVPEQFATVGLAEPVPVGEAAAQDGLPGGRYGAGTHGGAAAISKPAEEHGGSTVQPGCQRPGPGQTRRLADGALLKSARWGPHLPRWRAKGVQVGPEAGG